MCDLINELLKCSKVCGHQDLLCCALPTERPPRTHSGCSRRCSACALRRHHHTARRSQLHQRPTSSCMAMRFRSHLRQISCERAAWNNHRCRKHTYDGNAYSSLEVRCCRLHLASSMSAQQTCMIKRADSKRMCQMHSQSMDMHQCMHTRTHTHKHTHTHTHTRIHVHMHIHMHIRIHNVHVSMPTLHIC